MGFLDEKHNIKVFNETVKEVFGHLSANITSKPTFILFGGQPGAGKSAIIENIQSKYNYIAIINGDEYRRKHPNYKEIKRTDPLNMPELTQDFVYGLLEELKNYAFNNKLSFALESTFHNGQLTADTFNRAKENGYSTQLHILSVHPSVSYLSTIKRYEDGLKNASIGRLTPKEKHFDRASKNADALKYCLDNNVADSFHLYKRKITIDKTETSVKHSPLVTKWEPQPTNILEAFIQERTRPLNREERICYSIIANDLIKKMESKEVSKSEIETFKKDLKQILNPDPDKNISKGLKR